MDEFALFQSEIQELEETNAKEESKEEDKVPIQFRKNAGVVISAPAAIKADAFEPRGRPVSPEKKEEDDGFGGAIGPNFQPPPPPPPQVSTRRPATFDKNGRTTSRATRRRGEMDR